jgi:hypothetical protein
MSSAGDRTPVPAKEFGIWINSSRHEDVDSIVAVPCDELLDCDPGVEPGWDYGPGRDLPKRMRRQNAHGE